MIILIAILIAIIVAVGLCFAYHLFIFTSELQRRVESEISHKTDFKDLALKLTDRQLLERQLPTLQESLPAPIEEEEDIREKTIAELEEEMREVANPISASMAGRLGQVRMLAKELATRKQNSAFTQKSDLATEDYVGELDQSELAHLSQVN